VADTPSSSDDRWNGKSGYVLTPARRRGVEFLDDPSVDAHDRRRAQDDIRRSNVWLGGLRAALAELRAVIAPRDNMILLDVGTGLADILAEATRDVRKSGGSLTTIGVDGALSLLATARGSTTGMVCADALALPFRDGSVDVAMCSQLLHHFTDADIERLLRELHRVSRRAVIVCDLRRSWLAAAGFWLVSFPLRFHPITRHDGVVSVLRGFTAGELRRHVKAATGASPRISHRLGFRLTARWTRAETASAS
jgi:SAM-dependent methyltransferase